MIGEVPMEKTWIQAGAKKETVGGGGIRLPMQLGNDFSTPVSPPLCTL